MRPVSTLKRGVDRNIKMISALATLFTADFATATNKSIAWNPLYYITKTNSTTFDIYKTMFTAYRVV